MNVIPFWNCYSVLCQNITIAEEMNFICILLNPLHSSMGHESDAYLMRDKLSFRTVTFGVGDNMVGVYLTRTLGWIEKFYF